MAEKKDKITIYVGEPTRQVLDENPNDSASGAINSACYRYLEAVKRYKPALTEPEWLGIVASILSTDTNNFDPRNLPIQLEDAIEYEHIEETIDGLNGKELLVKLKGLDYAGLVSVLHEAERRKSKI